MTDLPLSDKTMNMECEVCGSFKHQHERFCVDCTRYKEEVEDARKNKARQERFGRLW